MKTFLSLIYLCCIGFNVLSQATADSIPVVGKSHKQMPERITKLLASAEYPVIKSTKSAVLPVRNVTVKPDPTLTYTLLFELTYNNPDSLAAEVNGGLEEVGRIINLHVASGIPLKNIKPVVLVHGLSLHAILNNSAYQKLYKTDNPNETIMGELRSAGTEFIACGQAMLFFEVQDEELQPFVKKTLTAQTVLSSYQIKGAVLYKIDEVD